MAFNVGDKVMLPDGVRDGRVTAKAGDNCEVTYSDFESKPLGKNSTQVTIVEKRETFLAADLKPIPIKTLAVQVADLSDWDVILVTEWGHISNDLPKKVANEVMHAAWSQQDGYGEPGYTPPQGWDWSGIRDSTPEGHKNVANAIRRVLAKHRVTTLNLTWDSRYVKWEPGKEDE